MKLWVSLVAGLSSGLVAMALVTAIGKRITHKISEPTPKTEQYTVSNNTISKPGVVLFGNGWVTTNTFPGSTIRMYERKPGFYRVESTLMPIITIGKTNSAWPWIIDFEPR